MKSALVIAAVLLSASPAHAFHEIVSYNRTANTGGGSGVYFTGSPRFKGYDCSICHTGAAEQISIELRSDPPELVSGRYEPGVVYRIDVQMLGEHLGLESAFNPNTFAVEILDAGGFEVGSWLAQPNNIVELSDNGRVALAEGFGEGETEWTVFWRAPDNAKAARLFLGAVDGDGASDPERRWIDAVNDDVATVELGLCPIGSDCPEPAPPVEERSAVQCSAAGSGIGLLPWLLLVVLLLRLTWRAPKRATQRAVG